MNYKKYLYHGSRMLIALVFLYAGSMKAQDIVAFAGQIAQYQLLPYAWNYVVAGILPYLELLCGVLLLVNQRVRPATLVLFVLNLMFIAVLASAVIRGFDIDCGCFNSAAEHPTTPLTALLRDVGLLVLMILTWVLAGSQEQAAAEGD